VIELFYISYNGGILNMKLFLECVPCVINEIVRTTKRLITDESKQYETIQKSVEMVSKLIREDSSAPVLTGEFYEMIRNILNVDDVYLAEKDFYNKEMMALEDGFKRIIRESENPLYIALMLSGAANIIDFGVPHSLDKQLVVEKILSVLNKGQFPKDLSILAEELKRCNTLVYIGDNCGEAVLDKLVLEIIKEMYPSIKIFYAVRGVPVMNDITEKEAYDIGIDKYATIISSGTRVPGTIFKKCNKEFQDLYKSADIKLLKGVGNLETADRKERDAYFIFMVKCSVMANKLNKGLHEVIVAKGNPLYKDKLVGAY
jgi:hypothetical protein